MRTSNGLSQDALKSLIDREGVTSRKSVVGLADRLAMKRNRGLLEQIAREIPTSPINGFASLVNYAPLADRPVHRWFWYREGYSLDLVKDAIRGLPKGSLVLDPFCGAGTTLLAARELGFPSIGVDVNPMSVLVSRVKTTPLQTTDMAELDRQISRIRRSHADLPADPPPGLEIIDKVFDPGVLHALLVLRRLIDSTDRIRIREFLLVAWISMLEGVSNVYKEGNGIKYKNRKRVDAGYINLDLGRWQAAAFPHDRFSYVRGKLLEKIEMMREDLVAMPASGPPANVFEGTADDLGRYVAQNSVTLTIFSPPYCNCFNYFKTYKIELWMGGFVKSYEEMRSLSRRGLRSHVETILRRDGDEVQADSEQFASLLDGQDLWDKRIPQAVRGYFIDMRNVLREVHRSLKPSGQCMVVVGNSAYAGIVIPTDALIAKIGIEKGLLLESLSIARSLTTSSQQRSALEDRLSYLRESIVVLKKEDPRLVDKELKVTDELPLSDRDRRGYVFLIKNNGLTSGTHKFHRYPAKFIPHVPRWAIRRFLSEPRRSVVVDPFCGSGTTLVEASLFGARAFGVDVDPIARLVSRVKTRPLPAVDIDAVRRKWNRYSSSRPSHPRSRPVIPTLPHWFSGKAIRELGVIRDFIDRFDGDAALYEFLLVCFASIVRRSSNADNQTQKTYVSHTKTKQPESALLLFGDALVDYGDRILALSKTSRLGKVRVLENADARCLSGIWASQRLPKIDLVITSPPYLNSVDYVYNQMAEYFWLGDLYGLEDQPKQNEYKKRYIGTNKIGIKDYPFIGQTGIPEVDQIVSAVSAKSKKNGFVIAKYFADMKLHFADMGSILRRGTPYICVIGDSLVSGESVPVHELIVKCAERAGFQLSGECGYEIRNRHMRFPRQGRGGIVRYDWILEFQKR